MRDGAVTTGRVSGPTARSGGWLKPLVVVAGLAVGVGLAWRLGAFELLSIDNIDRMDAWFDGLGIWAPVVFILLWVAACVFFLPGLPISIAGGLIFGAFWGTVYTTIGANLGAAAAFVIGRYVARGMVERRMADNAGLRRIDEGVTRHGWRMLMITRLVPIFPFNIQNFVYGLTDISLGTYVLVSLVCMLPGTIAYNLAAGAVRTGDFGRTLWYLGIAAVFFVVLSLLPGWLKKRYSSDELGQRGSPGELDTEGTAPPPARGLDTEEHGGTLISPTRPGMGRR